MLFIPLPDLAFLWPCGALSLSGDYSFAPCRCPCQSCEPPLAIVPWIVGAISAKQGLELAFSSPAGYWVHVDPEEHSELLHEDWERYVIAPFREAGRPSPEW